MPFKEKLSKLLILAHKRIKVIKFIRITVMILKGASSMSWCKVWYSNLENAQGGFVSMTPK